jgi:hypothetical protein
MNKVMKRLLISLAIVTGCSRTPTVQEPPEAKQAASSAVKKADIGDRGAGTAADVEPPGDEPEKNERLTTLLSQRFDGGMGYTFAQFANMFLVKSRISLGEGIGLMTPSREVAEKTLQSPYPEFYRPTVQEFLDEIALQTSTEWKSDTSGKYIENAVPDVQVDGPMIFEFLPTKREKPFEVTLAEGWKSNDRGSWLMLVPPGFPVGLDIYEMGVYSADVQAEEPKLLERVPIGVALGWIARIQVNADKDSLKAAKVGTHDALFFETTVPSQVGEDVHWRQWTFMVGNRCYGIVSTILPSLEDTIYPDVEKMLASFREKLPH